MQSLGFVRNPQVEADDHANETRWCRLPNVDNFKEDQFFSAIVVPISYGEDSADDSGSSAHGDTDCSDDENEVGNAQGE